MRNRLVSDLTRHWLKLVNCWRAWSSPSLSTHRSFSAPTIPPTPGNEVHTRVTSGIGKPIDIRIIYPPRLEHGGPIILALGSGGYVRERVDYAHLLSWSTNATIVQPSYQISRDWPFPAPVHMTLRVFDWISQNLAGTDAYSDKQKIAVCGEDVGGSLAAMLALTESHSARPHISAAAVSNPILDWSDIFPENGEMTSGDMQPADQGAHCTPKANDATCLGISVGGLINMRKDIFRKAEDFFDPFASPMLFFRTACFDLPSHLNRPSSVTLHNQSSPPNEAEHTSITRKRTYLRAYPPSGSGLLLPPMKITFGKEHVLKDQSMEFLSLMQRSLSRGKRLPGMPDETNARSTCVAEERENIGMWDQRLVLELGQWLSEVLRRR